MRAYDAATLDGGVMVTLFAKTTDQAAELFCDHHLAVKGSMPGSFSLERRTIRMEPDQGGLRRALLMGKVGRGVMDARGWNILPIPQMDAPS